MGGRGWAPAAGAAAAGSTASLGWHLGAPGAGVAVRGWSSFNHLQSLAAAPTASSITGRHLLSSQAAAHPFPSLAGLFLISLPPPLLPFQPFPSPPSPKCLLCRSQWFWGALVCVQCSVGFGRDWRQFRDKAGEGGSVFSVTSQLNWIHKVLSFICQGVELELNIALRAGRAEHNGADRALNGSAVPGSELSSALCVWDCMWAWK